MAKKRARKAAKTDQPEAKPAETGPEPSKTVTQSPGPLPRVQTSVPAEPEVVTTSAEPETTLLEPGIEIPPPGTVSVSVPWKESTGHMRRSHTLNLTGAQARTLKNIQVGLDAEKAVLANGNKVTTYPRAIQWMLENFK